MNLPKDIFEVPMNADLVHQVFISQRANQRQVSAHTKNRAEVRGGGAKPFRQKGTGRARQGSSRDSHQVGGGVAFGPKPKKYEHGLSKKAWKGALRTTLSMQCRENALYVLKDLKWDQVKTKSVAQFLKKFSLEKGLIIDIQNENLQKSSANLRSFKFLKPEGVNVYDLLKFKNVIVSEPAILQIEKRLQS